jgi:excinuclease ABC subunit C
MNDRLKQELAGLPDKAGIYFFKGRGGEIIYIGKARSLRDRVRSYFQPSSDPKVANIVSETEDLDFILTGSEREAAFLENNFVQRYQPKFNLRLKDDKSFPYLRLTVNDRFPAVTLTRKVEPDGARYFGPFSPASRARKTIHLVNRYFGVRACEEAVPGHRRRPCLEFDLKLCSAPCTGAIGEAEYRERVSDALLFLEGRTSKLVPLIERRMKEASDKLDFEQAAHWRDLLRTIEQVRERPRLISVALEDADIFGLARSGGRASLYIFFMRRGKVRDAEEMIMEESPDKTDDQILGRVLEGYYGRATDLPDRVLIPRPLGISASLARALTGRKGSRVRVLAPRRGRDLKLVELAVRNAENLLERRPADPPSLVELARLAGLGGVPARIEGFDISNTGGEESVGSLVVFDRASPNKDEYRKYRIKSVAGPNDVASLAEVIRRRYTRLLAEKGRLPELILVDGGKGQLNAARNALGELGLETLPVISIAKKEELLFVPGRAEGIRLDRTSPALKLVQFIRDEAHRFAISFHRQRREKRSFASELDGIPGLGEKRKKALLARFQSFEEIRRASYEELASVVGTAVARRLLEAERGA